MRNIELRPEHDVAYSKKYESISFERPELPLDFREKVKLTLPNEDSELLGRVHKIQGDRFYVKPSSENSSESS
jgi:hypothetical protein